MHLRNRVSIVALVAAIALSASACGSDASTPARPSAAAAGVPTDFRVVAGTAVEAVATGATLLDVRRDDEWAAGRAAKAQHFALTKLEAGERPALDEGDRIFVYCTTGRRAAKAVAILRKAGFTRVTNIGGLRDWQQAGGALAK